MNKQIRTCVSLVYYDGATNRTLYHVFRGPMARNGKAFNCNKAEHVATIERFDKPSAGDDCLQRYREMAAAYATPDAPPVPWMA